MDVRVELTDERGVSGHPSVGAQPPVAARMRWGSYGVSGGPTGWLSTGASYAGRGSTMIPEYGTADPGNRLAVAVACPIVVSCPACILPVT